MSTNDSSKFKLDCAKSDNSYILLIDVINFKLRFINFVYFFETPDSIISKVTFKPLDISTILYTRIHF